MESAGEWLEKALVELCSKIETGLGLGLDQDIIKGLVSYCDLAEPRDAKEYLDVTLFLFSFLFYFTGYQLHFTNHSELYFIEFRFQLLQIHL